MLTRRPINCRLAAASVRGPGYGGVVVFEGRVRDREGGKKISSITYEAYGIMAERELDRICRLARRKYGTALYLRHRIGRVAAGEAAVVIACAGVHRRAAFAACRSVIEAVKKRVPIWKADFARRRTR